MNTFRLQSQHVTFPVTPHLGVEGQAVLLLSGCQSNNLQGHKRLHRLLPHHVISATAQRRGLVPCHKSRPPTLNTPYPQAAIRVALAQAL